MRQHALRVLLITESPAAGVGRHVADLAEGLLEKGCRVDLLFSRLRMDDLFAERMGSLRSLHYHQIDMRRSPHVADLKVMRQIRQYVRQQGPFDVIHGHSSKAGIVARSVRRCPGQAIVYTPHCLFTLNPLAGRLLRGAAGSVERWLARRTDAVIAVSPEEREHAITLGVAANKVHYIANGVAAAQKTNAAVGREQLGLPREATVIGFLGRMSPQKNPLLVLEAFSGIAPEFPHACLAMVGEGPLQPRAKQLAAKYGLSGRVHWLGYRSAEEVLPACDLFALPSRYEGMPYVLIEALAHGLPIVATQVGGVRLTVQHDQNGLIVQEQNPTKFAAALRHMLGDPQRIDRFGRRSLELAARFTVDRMIEETHNLYCRLLGRVPAALRSAPREVIALGRAV